MNQIEIVDALKNEVKTNPAASAVFHVFALRKRTRQNISINGLSQKMKAEGFVYSKENYLSILKLLSKMGIGRLVLSSRGNVKALTDIKTSLKSIGEAALGENSSNLKQFKPRTKFTRIVEKPAVIHNIEANRCVGLRFMLGNKELSIDIPRDFTADEIAGVLKLLQK